MIKEVIKLLIERQLRAARYGLRYFVTIIHIGFESFFSNIEINNTFFNILNGPLRFKDITGLDNLNILVGAKLYVDIKEGLRPTDKLIGPNRSEAFIFNTTFLVDFIAIPLRDFKSIINIKDI